MNIPNYILKAQSAERVPKEMSKVDSILKKVIIAIIILIILGSLIFRENLFFEISWTARIILIVLAVMYIPKGGKVFQPFPMEIRFYDEYCEFYFSKIYYNKKLQCQEIQTMKYDNLRLKYVEKYARLEIRGDGNRVTYNYDKNMNLPTKPSSNRDFKNGCFLVHIQVFEEIDIVKEIEEHSPIKVVVE